MSTPEDRIKEALEALEAQTPLAQAPEPSGPQAPRRSAPVLSKDMARELLSVPSDELTAAICRQSFFEFVKEFWGEIIPEKPHYNWHMPYICEVLQHMVMRVIRRQPKEWDLLINVPPGTSKPVWVESEVLMADGSYKKLKDVKVGDRVIGKSGRSGKVTHVHEQGMLDTVKIETFGGREHYAAPDHPFLTTKGWTNAGDLRPNDYLAVMHRPELEYEGSDRSIAECSLAGYIVGDGAMTHGNCSITNGDPEYVDHIVKLVESLGFRTRVTSVKTNKKTRIIAMSGGAREWTRGVGLAGMRSRDKRIPDFVWRSGREGKLAFLAAYFHADGSVTYKHSSKRNITLGVSTTSEGLAMDIMKLTTQLGVPLRLRKRVAKSGFAKDRGIDDYTYYVVETSSQDDAARFLEIVPVHGRKRDKLAGFVPTKSTFDQPYHPDRVKEITPAGKRECRCLTVEDESSFTIQDTVVHNSTLVTVMLQPWAWTIDPTLRFITGSYSGDLSTDHNEKSRQIIKSEKYKRLFPKVAIAQSHDNKTHFKSTQNGERLRTSTGGTVTGIHAHVLIMDDPLNPKQAASEKELKAASTFIDETLFSRKVDKDVTPTIIVMQRLHEDDPTGNWLKKRKGQVMHISLPAEITEKAKPIPAYLEQYYEGGLLDPVRMSRNALNDMRTALGSYGYAGQFLQMPAPEDGGIWQRWIRPIPDAQLDEMVQNKTLRRFGTDWDLAYTSKDQNSATAFVEAGELDGKMYINDFGCKWFEFPKLVNFMRLRRAPHYIEGKASGKSAKQMLTHRGIPAIEIPVTGGDKIARTQMSTPYAEAGLVYCRESKLEELYEMEKQGILLFPNNSHDDLNDALTQSIQRIFGRRLVVV